MAVARAEDFDGLVREMTAELSRGPAIFLPSRFWHDLNARNAAQLADRGFASFKRTVNQNYFGWVVSDPRDPQFLAVLRAWLRRPTPSVACARPVDVSGAEGGEKRFQPFGKRSTRVAYGVFVAMLWEFARRRDRLGLLPRLSEPELGSPILVRHGTRLISQDLANSVLEFYAINEARPIQDGATVIELGGGYGRLGWVMLSAIPRLRYVAVDIPPALAIAQRYLTELFPAVPAYRFRPGTPDAEAIRRARLVFLTPNQLDALPSMAADFFVNISSLHEMRPEQVARYLELADRHTRGVFYMKEWRSCVNPADQVTLRQGDYPIPTHWRKRYARPHPIQTHFFEAAYLVGRETPALRVLPT